MPFGKSRMRVAVDSIVATRWCFPPQQAATDLDKKETSHFTHSDTFPTPAEEKHEGFSCL